jgi:hypothetical protein
MDMIRAITNIDGPPLTVNATVGELKIYLDSWALNDLAEGDSSRRRRFIGILHSGADLLFSASNAAELSGPHGRSVDLVRAFLDEIGPHWYPVELDAFEVIKRELNGQRVPQSYFSERFLRDYVPTQMKSQSLTKIDITKLVCLGGVLDWVGPQRESIRQGRADFDDMLDKKIGKRRRERKQNPARINQRFPALPFKSDMPANFVFHNLLRTLIVEGQPIKKGDGLDFCHAVIGIAFADFVALDKHWKRRVEGFPSPNGLCRTYCGPELDKMVTDIESAVIPATP